MRVSEWNERCDAKIAWRDIRCRYLCELSRYVTATRNRRHDAMTQRLRCIQTKSKFVFIYDNNIMIHVSCRKRMVNKFSNFLNYNLSQV